MAEHIPLEPIASTNLAALGYNPTKQILAIQFKSGAIFHYAGVSLELAAGFNSTESFGRYYVEHIKGKFTGARMTGPCPRCKAEGWLGDTCTDCGTATYQEKPRHADTHPLEAGSSEADGAPQPVQEQEAPPSGEPHRRRRPGARAASPAAVAPERRPRAHR